MRKAIIYKAQKNVMQSGHGKTQTWILEYDEDIKRSPENLNGWTSASNTTGQVQLKFETLEQAQNFADKQGLQTLVKPASTRKVRPRNYTDNFKYIPPEDEK